MLIICWLKYVLLPSYLTLLNAVGSWSALIYKQIETQILMNRNKPIHVNYIGMYLGHIWLKVYFVPTYWLDIRLPWYKLYQWTLLCLLDFVVEIMVCTNWECLLGCNKFSHYYHFSIHHLAKMCHKIQACISIELDGNNEYVLQLVLFLFNL